MHKYGDYEGEDGRKHHLSVNFIGDIHQDHVIAETADMLPWNYNIFPLSPDQIADAERTGNDDRRYTALIIEGDIYRPSETASGGNVDDVFLFHL